MQTAKTDLLPLLEKDSSSALDDIHVPSTAIMVDGMALLQSLSSPGRMFEHVAATVLRHLLSSHPSSRARPKRVDFVVDT